MADSLRPTGVRLIAENQSGFQQALTNANNAVARFGQQASQSAQGGTSALTIGTIALGTALGNLAFGAVQSAISAVGNLAGGAIDATSRLQQLTVSLESLAAREIMAAGGADDMNSALSQAGPVAQNLLRQIRDLSLVSPFEYEDIVQVFRLNMAFGQTSEMSLKLTKAITDLAAASGAGGAMLERIAYNFSQMSLTGQITMRDVRDLAMAGVDLARVLREELNMSIEETNAALQSGALTMEEVSEAFVTYADRNFGSAAERMSRTLSGVASSFRDLAFFSSIDVFGGAVQKVTDYLGELLNKAMAVVDSGALQKIGSVLEMVAGKMVDFARQGESAVGSFLSRFGSQMSAAAENALRYGINITTQLAAGIIEGAAGALTAAMNFISGILSLWLAPGSPPKVAPWLPEWGASAMTEWLKGFSKADFDVLQTIQAPLQDALQILAQTGSIGKDAVGAIYADVSKAIAEALAGGGASDDLFRRIADSAGEFGAEIADLARRQFALAEGVNAVRNAEEALEAARKRQQAAFANVNRLTQEYNALLRAGASEDELALKREQINAAQEAQRAATEQVSEAEDGLEIERQRLALLEEQAKMQEELIRQLLEIARMAIITPETPEEPKTPGGGGETGKGGAGGAGGGAIPTPEIPMPPTGGVIGQVEEFKQKLQDKLKDLFKPVTEAWENQVKPALQRLQDAWTRFADLVSQAYNTYIKPVVDSVRDWFPDSTMSSIANNLGKFAGAALVVAAALGILSVIVGIITSPIVVLGAAIVVLAALWETYGNRIKTTVEQIGFIIVYYLNLAAQTITDWAVKAFTPFEEWVSKVITKVEELFDRLVGGSIIPEMMAAIYDTITGGLTEIEKIWSTIWDAVLAKAAEIWDDILEKVTTVINDTRSEIQARVDEIESNWKSKWDAILTKLRQVWDGIRTKVETEIAAIQEKITTAIEDIRTKWEEGWNAVQAVIDKVFDAATGIVGKIARGVDSIIEKFTGPGGLATVVSNIVNGPLSELESVFNGIKSAIQGVVTWIGNFISAVLAGDFGRALDLISQLLGLGGGGGGAGTNSAFLSGAPQTVTPAMPAGYVLAGGSSSRTMHAEFNATVNHPVDVEMLRTVVRQEIERAFA